MDSRGDASGRPNLTIITVKNEIEESTDQKDETRELEPVTPIGRIFSQPSFNCHIIIIFRLKTEINVEAVKTGLRSTLFKHKRFTSIMKKNEDGIFNWVPVTVNMSDHVIVPFMDSTQNDSPDFSENYAANLATVPPLDPSRPLWQLHLLNVRSGEATSSAVLRVHHSLGDGMSLMSLLLACTNKAGEPSCLPTIPRQTRSNKINGANCRTTPWFLGALCRVFLVFWYTMVDVLYFVASTMWIKDSDTPIKGYPGVEWSPKQIVYQTLSLEDVKLVKNAMNGTVNDVLLGITFAGIARYLERQYGEERSEESEREAKRKAKQSENNDGKGVLPSKLRVRSTVLVNIRPAPGLHELAEMMNSGKKARWGNDLGYIIISLPLKKQENPLDYVRAAIAIIQRKKLSLEAPFTYALGNLLFKLAGVEAATKVTKKLVSNTTFSFSNMVGPVQEVEFFGHRVMHIIPTVAGHSHSLTMHFQSYMGKVTLVVTAATDVITDPKQLCLDCVDAFQSMKQAASAKAM